MNSYTIYDSFSGKITKNLFCSINDIESNTLISESFIEGLYSESTGYIYNNAFVPFPNKPTIYHTWDWVSKTYIITSTEISTAKKHITEVINQTRNNLSMQPITYDNKVLDADTQALVNINGKLQEIFGREATNNPLVSPYLFWRDANDIDHTWSDQESYKLWLQGLVIAISSRNTQLYSIAWTKQAEVDSLTDINDILSYDVNAGWT